MFLIDFLRDHDHLWEMFLEGRNPESERLLNTAEIDAVRPHLAADDAIRACVRGRIVGANRGFWVVTDRLLLVVEMGLKPTVRQLPLAHVDFIGHEAGKYGHGLSVEGDGRRFALYAAAPGLAQLVAESVARVSGATPTGDAQPAGDAALAHARYLALDASVRAQPVRHLAAA